MKLRRKPIEVEAERVSTLLTMHSTEEGRQLLPEWIKKRDEKDEIVWAKTSIEVFLHGEFVTAGEDDYLIRGVNGEVYPASRSAVTQGYDVCL